MAFPVGVMVPLEGPWFSTGQGRAGVRRDITVWLLYNFIKNL